MEGMKLDIITPDSTIFSGEVTSVSVPGADGRFQVLKGHAPIISTLVEGPLKFSPVGGEEQFFRAFGGVVEVLKNKIIVLVERIEKEESN
jgi:F-type H+-transporting ATPase subunit epsilon